MTTKPAIKTNKILTVPFASRIPAALHKEIKIASVKTGIKVQTIVAEALAAWLPTLTKKKSA